MKDKIKKELWKLPHIEFALAFSFYMVFSFASKFITENNLNYHPSLPLFLWLITLGLPVYLYTERLRVLKLLSSN